jgi:hypothetical protein
MSWMPLMRGQILQYDVDRMAFEFTMLNNEGGTVRCQISAAAMDELAGARGTPPDEREAQFMSFRDRIESIASDDFDHGARGAAVRIFAKHIRSLPHLLASPDDDRR